MRRKHRWSQTYKLATDCFRELPDQPGVYRIRAFDYRGRPVPFQRLHGTDRDGILHIGQSQNIRARIAQFHRSAQSGHGNHHAGNEFNRWEFAETFPVQSLRFDYFLTESPDQALRHERLLHERYRRQYLDRPPLDGTSGQRNASKKE